MPDGLFAELPLERLSVNGARQPVGFSIGRYKTPCPAALLANRCRWPPDEGPRTTVKVDFKIRNQGTAQLYKIESRTVSETNVRWARLSSETRRL